MLGKTTAEALFPDQNPVGEKIRIRNTPFDVIGVLTKKGQAAMGSDQDDIVLAPATTVLNRLKGGRYIDMINASAVSSDQMTEAQEELRTLMREAHHLKPGDDDDFTIRSQAEITDLGEDYRFRNRQGDELPAWVANKAERMKKIREAPVTDDELNRVKDAFLNAYAFDYDKIIFQA